METKHTAHEISIAQSKQALDTSESSLRNLEQKRQDGNVNWRTIDSELECSEAFVKLCRARYQMALLSLDLYKAENEHNDLYQAFARELDRESERKASDAQASAFLA